MAWSGLATVQQRRDNGKVIQHKISGGVFTGYDTLWEQVACCCSPCYCDPARSQIYGDTFSVTVNDLTFPAGCYPVEAFCCITNFNDTHNSSDDTAYWQWTGMGAANNTFCLKQYKAAPYGSFYPCYWLANGVGTFTLYNSQFGGGNPCGGGGYIPIRCQSMEFYIALGYQFDPVQGGMLTLIGGAGSGKFGSTDTGFTGSGPPLLDPTKNFGFGLCDTVAFSFGFFTEGTPCAINPVPSGFLSTDPFHLDCDDTIHITKNNAVWYENNQFYVSGCDQPLAPYGQGSKQVLTPTPGHPYGGDFLITDNGDTPC